MAESLVGKVAGLPGLADAGEVPLFVGAEANTDAVRSATFAACRSDRAPAHRSTTTEKSDSRPRIRGSLC